MYLSPSIMCADFSNLKAEVEFLDKCGASGFHIDIMDGKYVPNFGMGIQDISHIRSFTEKTIDVHLMVQEPIQYIDLFCDLGSDIIYFHPDACVQSYQTMDKIKANGKKAGIAITPGVSIDSIKELLPEADYILVMTVNPGFAGQKYIEPMNSKIQDLLQLRKKYEYKIHVDGALSYERIKGLFARKVDGFVLGTSILFRGEDRNQQIIDSFDLLHQLEGND
jgi:ribulose-phosphate 3-epimerase